MLDLYYDTESPIPDDPAFVAKRIRMLSHVETVKALLNEFFSLQEDGWHSSRADAEIAAYKRMQDGGRNGANKRWSKAGDSHPITTPSPALSPPQANPNSNQEPITKNQEPESKPKVVSEPGKPGCPPCPIEEIISAYHEVLPTLPKVRIRTAKRDSQIRARWRQFYEEGDFQTKEGGVDCFRWLFESKVKPSRFLTGQTQTNGRKPFLADLEWITNQGNFAKIIEGRYEHQN